jgi:hypothetical protein
MRGATGAVQITLIRTHGGKGTRSAPTAPDGETGRHHTTKMQSESHLVREPNAWPRSVATHRSTPIACPSNQITWRVCSGVHGHAVLIEWFVMLAFATLQNPSSKGIFFCGIVQVGATVRSPSIGIPLKNHDPRGAQ